MADLVNGIAGDVLRTIGIELLKSQLIAVLSPGGESSELGILYPQIALQDFGCGQEPEDRNISIADLCFAGSGVSQGAQAVAEKSCTYCCRGASNHALLEK